MLILRMVSRNEVVFRKYAQTDVTLNRTGHGPERDFVLLGTVYLDNASHHRPIRKLYAPAQKNSSSTRDGSIYLRRSGPQGV